MDRGARGDRGGRPAHPRPSRPALDGELVVRLRQRHARPVHAPDRDGHLPGAGLRALGGRGLPEPAVPELPGAVRLVPAGHALLGLERDGRGDDAAHDPGLPLRRAQVSARDDLGRRLPALPVHARHGLHRPGPALGPGRVLGARHQRVDRRALAGDRRSGGARAPRGPDHRGADAVALLRRARLRHPRAALRADRPAPLARAQDRHQRVADARPAGESRDVPAAVRGGGAEGRRRVLPARGAQGHGGHGCHHAHRDDLRGASSALTARAAFPIPR